MTENLHPLEALELEMTMDAMPDLNAEIIGKIERVSRANAFTQLTAILIDTDKDDMVRMGAANIILQATQPLARPPVVEVHPYAAGDEVEPEDEPEA